MGPPLNLYTDFLPIRPTPHRRPPLDPLSLIQTPNNLTMGHPDRQKTSTVNSDKRHWTYIQQFLPKIRRC